MEHRQVSDVGADRRRRLADDSLTGVAAASKLERFYSPLPKSMNLNVTVLGLGY